MLRYIEAFLTGRTASISTSGETSNLKCLTCGVPQGSVLSPLLFSVALAALPQVIQISNNKRLKTQVQLAVYADDIALWSSARGTQRLTVQTQLQKALNNTRHFLATLGLQLSASKSVVLCVAPRRTHKFQLELHLGGIPIPVRRRATYLGITLDDKATWKPAVNIVLKAMATQQHSPDAWGTESWYVAKTSTPALQGTRTGTTAIRPTAPTPRPAVMGAPRTSTAEGSSYLSRSAADSLITAHAK